MKSLTIGELAKRADVHVQTIRFYERQGLVPHPPRRASGYRAYSADTVARVRFIRAAKDVGFSLGDIAELLALRVRRGASCVRIRQKAELTIATIDAKIAQLRSVRRILHRLVAACSGERAIDDCAILEGIEKRST